MIGTISSLNNDWYLCGKVQWNSLAIEILLHQTFRQLTAAFVSGMIGIFIGIISGINNEWYH